MTEQLTYMELFAGAGGLAEGFMRAGFTPITHIEIDKYVSLTIKTRLAYYYLKKQKKLFIYRNYLKGKISRNRLYSYLPEDYTFMVTNEEIRKDNLFILFKKVEENLKRLGLKKINVIAGGPPCQAYSLVGRARDPYNMENDPRNYLYKLYAKFLQKFKPEVFVFENVPGLLSAGEGKLWEDVKKHFEDADYEVDYKILNAYDSGVLQNRKRVIVIGYRKKLDFHYPEFKKNEEIMNYKVRDILIDLPSLLLGERIIYGNYVSKPTSYLKKYKLRSREDILTLHITRKINERDRKIYHLAIKMWEKHKKRLMYTDVPEKYRTQSNQKSFLDRFKVVASNLPCSHTVVAHLAKDGHYYIHPDINQLRSISVREAARLQSFPDNYYFEGPMTAKFRQIGNAVPPLLAEKIARKIKEVIA
ncbi:Modification methylase HaeIII [subsurface metagenome]